MRTEELVAIFRARPEGILATELREIMGVRRSSKPKRLFRLRGLGLLGQCGSSIYSRWYAVEHKATALVADERYRMAAKAASREAKIKRERARSAGRKRSRAKSPKAGAAREPADIPIVQRLIPVGEASMRRKPGPASVWDLAA